MSVPMADITFGDIIYKEQKYRILSNPLNKEIREKVAQYKKEKGVIFCSQLPGGKCILNLHFGFPLVPKLQLGNTY